MWRITTTMLQFTDYVGVFIVCVWDSAVFVVESTGCSITLGSAGAYRQTHTHTHTRARTKPLELMLSLWVNTDSLMLRQRSCSGSVPSHRPPLNYRNVGGTKKEGEHERGWLSWIDPQFPVCSCLIQPDLWWLGEEFNDGNQPSNFEFQCFKNVEAIFF